jgi:hypothetical protein
VADKEVASRTLVDVTEGFLEVDADCFASGERNNYFTELKVIVNGRVQQTRQSARSNVFLDCPR